MAGDKVESLGVVGGASRRVGAFVGKTASIGKKIAVFSAKGTTIVEGEIAVVVKVKRCSNRKRGTDHVIRSG